MQAQKMTREEMIAVADQAKPGTKLRLTYDPQATGSLIYLKVFLQTGMITTDIMTEAVIEAVRQSGDWEHDDNRSLTVVITAKCDMETFKYRTIRDLERLEVVT